MASMDLNIDIDRMTDAKRRRGALSILTQKGYKDQIKGMRLPVSSPIVIYNTLKEDKEGNTLGGDRFYTYNGVFHVMVPEGLIGGLAKADPFRCEWAWYFELACFWLTRDDRSMLLYGVLGELTGKTKVELFDAVYKQAVAWACTKRGGTPKQWEDYVVPDIIPSNFVFDPRQEIEHAEDECREIRI